MSIMSFFLGFASLPYTMAVMFYVLSKSVCDILCGVLWCKVLLGLPIEGADIPCGITTLLVSKC